MTGDAIPDGAMTGDAMPGGATTGGSQARFGVRARTGWPGPNPGVDLG